MRSPSDFAALEFQIFQSLTTSYPRFAPLLPQGEEKAAKLCSNGNKRRAQRAVLIGLTYEEYVLEILERGRYLSASDTERIAQIVAKRGVGY